MAETLEEKIARVTAEHVEVVAYDPATADYAEYSSSKPADGHGFSGPAVE